MPKLEVYSCQCVNCQQETPHPDQQRHWQMNLFLSRLDEQQRRWYVAMEADRIGAGSDRMLSQITGMDEKTIQRGRQELAASLAERPSDGCVCQGQVDQRQKKRCRARIDFSEAGRAGNSRGSDE